MKGEDILMNYLELAKGIEEYTRTFRRELHMYPELSGQEFETQKKIMRELDKLGIPYRKVGTTSLVATLKGGTPGKTVALRGDIDALPVKEESGVEFASKTEGVMHACGHDAHTAMLLSAAKLLNDMKHDIKGEVRFFFQEAEETSSGAEKIIAEGGMDGVDTVFGMHGMPHLKVGEASIESGYRMAGCDTIYLKFEGVSGHGSMPHMSKDSIHAAAQFTTELQSIITKQNDAQDPLVLSVGRFHGGTKANIIAKYTELDISMRYFTPEARKVAHDGIRRLAKSIADLWEIKVEVEIEESALSLYNDPDPTELARTSFTKVAGEDGLQHVPKMMGSEDMPYYFQKAPGVYALMGYRNDDIEAIYFPHHEKFKIDEEYMKYGVALHVQFAMDFLNRE